MSRRLPGMARLKTAILNRGMKLDVMIITAVLALLVTTLVLAPRAHAQLDFPRLGISASAASYVDTLTVDNLAPFTLYVCAFGSQPGQPLDQDVTTLRWGIHQVCCGAVLEVTDIAYNPDFTHTGDPYQGVTSTAETCVTADLIVLATLTVRMDAPEPGIYLAAGGPFGPTDDCAGAHPLFMDMPMSVTINGDITPVSASTWDGLKAIYR